LVVLVVLVVLGFKNRSSIKEGDSSPKPFQLISREVDKYFYNSVINWPWSVKIYIFFVENGQDCCPIGKKNISGV
jgi:hypothetical protein